jgi:hypothetical protein
MKKIIGFSDFVSEFASFDGRMAKNGEPGNFDCYGLRVLFNYLEELAESCGASCEDYDLDVIALCCEYAQDDVESIADQYSIDIEGLDEDDQREAVLDYINENSTVCGETSSGDIVYQQF